MENNQNGNKELFEVYTASRKQFEADVIEKLKAFGIQFENNKFVFCSIYLSIQDVVELSQIVSLIVRGDVITLYNDYYE